MDYQLADPEIDRIFELTLRAFGPRNFGPDALANRQMGTRFDVEVARHFYPRVYDAAWLDRGKRLSRELALDTADGLEAVIRHVRTRDAGGDDGFVGALSARLRTTEARLGREASALAKELTERIRTGSSLTETGDRVATSLQRGIAIHLAETA